MVELEAYELGTRSADEINEAIAEFWRDLETEPALVEAVSAAGLDPAEVKTLNPAEVLLVQEGGEAGIDPLTVALIVMASPATHRVARDLWENVILPRIVRRWGVTSVGRRKSNKDS